MPEHVSGNSQNNRPVKERRGRSTFDLSHYIFGTHRFAQYNVNFIQDCVGGDKIPVRSSDVIDSYTLKAPLMQDIQKTKEYFYVPKQCILPINWEKLERLPALGDDVNATSVNSTIVGFSTSGTNVHNFISDLLLFPDAPASTLTRAEAITCAENYLRRLLFAELFFSDGSLLAATGVHLSELFQCTVATVRTSFDAYFDWVISFYINTLGLSGCTFGGKTYVIGGNRINSISIHRFLELARDDYSFSLSFSESDGILIGNITDFYFAERAGFPNANDTGVIINMYGGISAPNVDFTIDRCAAYQLVCAHYFSNDSIDFVHSADLWRQNMLSLWRSYANDVRIAAFPIFSYNGVDTPYDVLSYYIIDKFFFSAALVSGGVYSIFDYGTVTSSCLIGFFINLLGWRRSLRYQDYFTGAKSRPLAVGDFSVAVNNSAVDVIDITKKISLQRLANNVNRIGNSIDKWYKDIMGSDLNYDYHNPMWLASTRSTVYASKSENTADAQQTKAVSTVANFIGKDSNFEFTMRPDRNGIIIGITYYDIRRAYHTGIERMAQHIDRFDGFIPDMQFIGDQEVRANEISLLKLGSTPISYQLRNAEYKQRIDQCYGGFVDKLPGFAFLYKPEYQIESGTVTPKTVISPEFIRSRSDEFDTFYISLSGYSNAHYFHLIVKTFNDVKASRPMIFAPQIL